jgi:hypothetical protein
MLAPDGAFRTEGAQPSLHSLQQISPSWSRGRVLGRCTSGCSPLERTPSSAFTPVTVGDLLPVATRPRHYHPNDTHTTATLPGTTGKRGAVVRALFGLRCPRSARLLRSSLLPSLRLAMAGSRSPKSYRRRPEGASSCSRGSLCDGKLGTPLAEDFGATAARPSLRE